MVVWGLLLAGALSAAGSSPAAGPATTLARDRAAGRADAAVLAAAVVLPAGSGAVPADPDPAALAHAPLLDPYFASIDVVRFSTTPGTPKAVLAAVRRGLPAGTRSLGTGSESAPRGVSELNDGFSLPGGGVPGASGRPVLSVVAAARPGRTTAVRIDAVVRYVAPRLPGQRVPTSARVVTISESASSAGLATGIAITLTGGDAAARLAAVVNGLPFAARDTGVLFCPAQPSDTPRYTVTFRARPGGPALARVATLADTPSTPSLCAESSLVVAGRRQPGLLDGGRLVRAVRTLLRASRRARYQTLRLPWHRRRMSR